jgi:hypothetical protein
MEQVSIKYTDIFHCKPLQNLPKFGFLVWKQTIWQLCGGAEGREVLSRQGKEQNIKLFSLGVLFDGRFKLFGSHEVVALHLQLVGLLLLGLRQRGFLPDLE